MLTARRCATAPPGRHTDGRGLLLYVKPSGARTWVLRFQLRGKRRDMGLGPYPAIGLKEARELALEARRLIALGRDPLAEMRSQKSATFKEAATALIESKKSGWRHASHSARWLSSLERYAFPIIGNKNVAAIDTNDVLAVLQPIWPSKPETASRVRQRVEAVLDYAKVTGVRDGDNPARWRGHLAQILPRPSKVRPVQHLAALPWQEAPAFWAKLSGREGVAAQALRFTILTAARSAEVRSMTWRELDLEAATWSVPATRTKQAREHRVPLSATALAVVHERAGGDNPAPESLVFGSDAKPGNPLSDVGVTKVVRTMGGAETTVHGWRSTFKTWASEATGFPREVVELALAHRVGDAVEQAYQRGDLLQRRRKLMEAWAAYCCGAPDKVLQLQPRQAS